MQAHTATAPEDPQPPEDAPETPTRRYSVEQRFPALARARASGRRPRMNSMTSRPLPSSSRISTTAKAGLHSSALDFASATERLASTVE